MHTFAQTNIHNNASSDHRKATLIYSTVRMTNYMREPMKKKSVNSQPLESLTQALYSL